MLNDIIDANLKPGEDGDAFKVWAFGDRWDTVNGVDIVSCWNFLHRHDMVIYPSGNPREDIPRMMEVWRLRRS